MTKPDAAETEDKEQNTDEPESRSRFRRSVEGKDHEDGGEMGDKSRMEGGSGGLGGSGGGESLATVAAAMGGGSLGVLESPRREKKILF
ncbi:unnamed protein product [Arabis nemorensis]|uniref:Uncharacterized protein n=1 Tax=Arabis nemorensis TaxID=586526 RepID=A0A565C595_9BRAS|nr:unnamed protein product [Arabis nemorensis]